MRLKTNNGTLANPIAVRGVEELVQRGVDVARQLGVRFSLCVLTICDY